MSSQIMQMLAQAARQNIPPNEFWKMSLCEWRAIFMPQNSKFNMRDFQKLLQELKEE
jgi:hypothetical protein